MNLRGHAPTPLLLLGTIAWAAAIPVVLSAGSPATELPWFAGTGIFLGCAFVVSRKRPGERTTALFAIAGSLVALVQGLDGVSPRIAEAGYEHASAWAVLFLHWAMAGAVIAIALLIGLFPDGHPERNYEVRTFRGLRWLFLLPPLTFIGRSTLLFPSYHMLPDVPNPYHVPALSPVGTAAAVGVTLLQGAFAVGVVLLVLRYRRTDPARRRRIRWLLVPAILAAFVAALDLTLWRLYPEGSPSLAWEAVVSALWIAVIASLPVALTIALLRPDLLDVDRLIRKSLVYGFLWAAIASAYIAVAAGLGLIASRRFPLGLSILLTVLATVLFQPARRRLEEVADRWVFGARTDPARLITRLGAALEETLQLENLLPQMAETLKEGLGLEWVRVRLEPATPLQSEMPSLTVPIVFEQERLGVVECGPKRLGSISEEDEAVVTTFARQAALAVRNLRLTSELERSRVRLIQAQETERRRIERNIHDGVQQDLVALISHTAHVRTELGRGPAAAEGPLIDLQSGLRRVIAELRELAHGIHPSLLSDRGLLEAVEALASRSTVPVAVRADPALRGMRFRDEIEGAGYFTIAEALANVGKHSRADRAEITLARANGTLEIEVRDDGDGFEPRTIAGTGLSNLADRLSALGGRLDVNSRPGGGTIITAHLMVNDG